MEGFFYVKSNGDSKKYSRQAWKFVHMAVLAGFWLIFAKMAEFWISGTKSGMHIV